MEAFLDIVIPVRESDAGLSLTIASLVAQSDSGFCVLISDMASRGSNPAVDSALRQLTAARISARREKAPNDTTPVEHFNWASARATSASS